MYFYLHDSSRQEIQQTLSWTFMHGRGQPLVELMHAGAASDACPLAVDGAASVLHTSSAGHRVDHAYTPYGHVGRRDRQTHRLGFKGERYDPLSDTYALGQGYRLYGPGLMRFLAPDSFSPFGQGALNSYGFCIGDPINRSDPTGHISVEELTLRMKSMGLKAPDHSPVLHRSRVSSAPERSEQSRQSTSTPEDARPSQVAKSKKTVSFEGVVRAFETDEFTGLRAPVEVRASFRERLALSRQAGELFGQYEDQLKQYTTALSYSRSATNIRFTRNPYFADKMAAINKERRHTVQRLLDVQKAIAKLRY